MKSQLTTVTSVQKLKPQLPIKASIKNEALVDNWGFSYKKNKVSIDNWGFS